MKDNADGMTLAGADLADAMAKINPIEAARPLHRAMMHSKCYRVALRQRHHFRPRLHPRPLLGQHELATAEIATGLRQQDRDLERKHM